MSTLKEVELVSTGVFQPGGPVPFDRIEDVIGRLDKAPVKMQKFIGKLRPVVKDLIGIDQCYFAVDPMTQELTESNTSMLVKAIRSALKKASMEEQEIEAIFMGTAVPDQHTPPHKHFCAARAWP